MAYCVHMDTGSLMWLTDHKKVIERLRLQGRIALAAGLPRAHADAKFLLALQCEVVVRETDKLMTARARQRQEY